MLVMAPNWDAGDTSTPQSAGRSFIPGQDDLQTGLPEEFVTLKSGVPAGLYFISIWEQLNNGSPEHCTLDLLRRMNFPKSN